MGYRARARMQALVGRPPGGLVALPWHAVARPGPDAQNCSRDAVLAPSDHQSSRQWRRRGAGCSAARRQEAET
jgi:hypothetical protein